MSSQVDTSSITIDHDCNGIREKPSNPDASVSFELNVETDNDFTTSKVEQAIIQALKQAIVDAVAKNMCNDDTSGVVISSVFEPHVSRLGVSSSCDITLLQGSRSCSVYQGSVLVRYHLLDITDPTLQSLQAVIQHNEVIHKSLDAIQGSVDDIHEHVNEYLKATSDGESTTRVVHLSYNNGGGGSSDANDEPPVIDVFDEEEETITEDDAAPTEPTPAPANTLQLLPNTPGPTINFTPTTSAPQQGNIIVTSTKIEGALSEQNNNESNMLLIAGTSISAVLLFLLLCCCCRRRCRNRNNNNNNNMVPTNDNDDDDKFERSIHTMEDEASIEQSYYYNVENHPSGEEEEEEERTLQQAESPGQEAALEDGGGGAPHSCRSISCEECGPLFGKKKKRFPWSRDICTPSIDDDDDDDDAPSVKLASEEEGLFQDEDTAALERMKNMDNKLFHGIKKDDDESSGGVQFVSSSGGQMSTLRELVLQESSSNNNNKHKKQQRGGQPQQQQHPTEITESQEMSLEETTSPV